MNTWIYILVMIFVTAAIRILPMILIKKKITNTFLKSFLYYIPYVTLSLMTFPAIMQTTESPVPGLVALVAGVICAWFNLGLFPVALTCSGIVLILGLIF